jgi:ABC-type phosphate transport system substrate-binding protein
MRLITRLLTAVAGVLLLAAAPRAEAQEFQVIVHASNPAPALSRDLVAKLYLKTSLKWADGTRAAPVSNAASRDLSEAFAKTVLGKSPAALASYWQQQIFAGKDVPPPEKKSDADVIAFVKATPGAIGYVSATAALGPGVKVAKVN